MYTSVIILVIVYTLFLLYVYVRYNLDAKNQNINVDIYREELEISPSEAAYLINKNGNSLNIILADILSLINKKYIKMEIVGEGIERDYIFTKIKDAENTNIKSHEIGSFRLFFNEKDEVSLKQYIKEINKSDIALKDLELKSASVKQDIEFELEKQGLIDKIAERKLFKFNKFSIFLIFVFGFVCVFSLLLQLNAEIIEFTLIGTLFSLLLYNTTDLKEDKLTSYGAEMKNKSIGCNRYIKEYLMTDNKPLYMVNVLEYNYTMAVAFGLAKFGEHEFIHDTYKEIQIKKSVGNIIYIAMIIGTIILMIKDII